MIRVRVRVRLSRLLNDRRFFQAQPDTAGLEIVCPLFRVRVRVRVRVTELVYQIGFTTTF